ncbi:hypothetical protein ENROMM299B_22305 [Enterobacter roggenkampii]|nr:hypothetical protein AZ007_001314 [Citrobacter freundii]
MATIIGLGVILLALLGHIWSQTKRIEKLEWNNWRLSAENEKLKSELTARD